MLCLEYGAPMRIRTSDLCLRRAALYPAELWVPKCDISLSKRHDNRKSPQKIMRQMKRIYECVDLVYGVVHGK